MKRRDCECEEQKKVLSCKIMRMLRVKRELDNFNGDGIGSTVKSMNRVKSFEGD